MKNINKTKDNIKVDELDDKTRKHMFQKFVQAGGKATNEREKHPKKDAKHLKPALKTYGKPAQANIKESRHDTSADEIFETWLQKKLSRLLIRLRLFFLGVTGFSAMYTTTRFFHNLIHDYKTALLQFQVQYYHIFNPQLSKQIINQLDAVNPLYYELITMTANIFDRTLFNEIELLQKSDELVSIQKLKKHLVTLYRALYILYPYIERIESAYHHAYDIQSGIEKQKTTFYYERKKYIRNSLYITFYKLLPRLHILFCRYHNIYVDMTNPYIRTILHLSENDLPGKRKAVVQEAGTQHQYEHNEAEDTAEIPPHIAKGLSLMNMSADDIISLFPKDSSNRANQADKAVIAYALFKKFDDEFSIVLTTNKIKYNIQFTESGKIDYKNRLSDLYNGLRRVTESFDEYMHVLETYERIRHEKPMSNAQYIEYTKRLTHLEKKKKAASKNVRITANDIMDKIAGEMDIFIKDMNEDGTIIDNPQDFLEFDINIESARILHNKKVYEALTIAYSYAAALSFRLSSGDLAGNYEFEEGETPLSAGTKIKENTDSSGKDNEPQSVIKELDDLF